MPTSRTRLVRRVRAWYHQSLFAWSCGMGWNGMHLGWGRWGGGWRATHGVRVVNRGGASAATVERRGGTSHLCNQQVRRPRMPPPHAQTGVHLCGGHIARKLWQPIGTTAHNVHLLQGDRLGWRYPLIRHVRRAPSCHTGKASWSAHATPSRGRLKGACNPVQGAAKGRMQSRPGAAKGRMQPHPGAAQRRMQPHPGGGSTARPLGADVALLASLASTPRQG